MIYFASVKKGESKWVKIGYSSDPSRRFKQGTSVNAFDAEDSVLKIDPLVIVHGNGNAESQVHQYFSDSRIREDNFEMTPKLSSYIKWLRDQWFAVTTLREAKEGLHPVSYDMWNPSSVRVKDDTIMGSAEVAMWIFGRPEKNKDDYHTHPDIMRVVHGFMPEIDLDPASHPEANRTIRASHIYTVQDDGLSKPWYGRVWTNPPFSDYERFARKAVEEWRRGEIIDMCMLFPTRKLSNKYFQVLLNDFNSMMLGKGRMNFGGIAKNNPDDGHGILYFGRDVRGFERHLSELGACVRRSRRMKS